MDQLSGMIAFVKVVEEGSFTGAARALGLPKSTISRQVSALEDRLGARLLHRTTRNIHLTEAGSAFHTRCARVISDLEEAERAVSQLHEAPRGTLRISAPLTFGQLFVGDLVAAYLSAYPDVRVDLSLSDRLVDLVEDGYDLAIRVGRLADSSLVARKLGALQRALVASPAYLDGVGRPSNPAELERLSGLLYAYEATGGGWRLKGNHVVSLSGRLSSNNGETLRAAAVAGLGVAYLPLFICGPDLHAGRLESLMADQVEHPGGVYAVYPPTHHPPAKVRAFVDLAVARFTPTPPWERCNKITVTVESADSGIKNSDGSDQG